MRIRVLNPRQWSFAKQSSYQMVENFLIHLGIELNPYINTLPKLSCFGDEISVLMHNRAVFRTAAGTAGSYVIATVSLKNGCQNFSYVHSSRKHW